MCIDREPKSGTGVGHFKQVGLWWECWRPYDPILVDIVRALPSPGRTWQPDTRTWRVNPIHVKRLAREIEAAGYQIDGLDPEVRGQLRESWETVIPRTRRSHWRRDIDG